MKQTKRMLALLLSLVLALSLLPAAALAAETEEDTITRKDFVMKLYEHPSFGLSERTSSGASAFSDLGDCTDAEKNAFGVLKDAGILTGGIIDGALVATPMKPLLRYEAVMFIWRAAGGASSGKVGDLPYRDVMDNDPFYDGINSLYAEGILTDEDMDEDGSFRPTAPVSPADVNRWLEAFIETGGTIPDAVEVDSEALAAELKTLGLFLGVDGDFELDRAPTRVEALVMLIRALGREEMALSGSWNHSFQDVPGWADSYIGYAYENGLTNGNGSDTQYGSDEDASAAMYLTFVLRALGYSDAEGDFVWSEPYALAVITGILPPTVELEDFQRGDLVVVTSAALGAKLKDSEQTLAEKLIEDGVFTQEQYSAATLIHSLIAD